MAVEPACGAVSGGRAARDRRIVELRRSGWALAEIAREFGVSYQRVAQIVDAAGRVDRDSALAARFDAHMRRAEGRWDEILARYRDGCDPQRIAADLGLDGRAVKRLVRARRTDADRSARALAHLSAHPGASGMAVKQATGIGHYTQAWKLLARLERQGMVDGRRVGRARAWSVTAHGRAVLAGLPEGMYVS